jgi:phage-related protein
MMILNGVDIRDAVPGIKIEDIRVSPVSFIPTVRDRAIQSGQVFVRMRQGTRTVAVTVAVLEANRYKRQMLLEDLTRWAVYDTPKPLSLSYYPGRLIDVICTGLPTPSTRQWWEGKLTITFTAYEPYFYSQQEKTANCGQEINIGGTASPLMRITRTLTSAGSNQSYSDNKDTLTFSTIPAGDLVIDINRQTAVVGNTSIMQYLSFSSSFIKPRTGQITITGNGAVKWRERWE